MKKELIDRVEVAISNAKHICSHADYGFRGHIEATPLEVYLLERIEKLEWDITNMKIKHEIEMNAQSKTAHIPNKKVK